MNDFEIGDLVIITNVFFEQWPNVLIFYITKSNQDHNIYHLINDFGYHELVTLESKSILSIEKVK